MLKRSPSIRSSDETVLITPTSKVLNSYTELNPLVIGANNCRWAGVTGQLQQSTIRQRQSGFAAQEIGAEQLVSLDAIPGSVLFFTLPKVQLNLLMKAASVSLRFGSVCNERP